MDREQVLNMIKDEIVNHRHTGLDSQRIYGNNIIRYDILEVVPTHTAEQGTLVIGKDSGTYKLYCMINGSWTAL